MKFRTLREEEIELRVGKVSENGYTLLLYKDARCDMNILDETVGAENWQRDHKEVKGNLYCGVGINRNYDNKLPIVDSNNNIVDYRQINVEPEWIWKWDCGIESREDKEGNQKKGEASDSFKRACVNWGIGRELYTVPVIKVYCETIEEKFGNKTTYKLPDTEKWRKFKVKEIVYNDKREITKLVIVDSKGVQVYPNSSKFEEVNMAVKKQEIIQDLKCVCSNCEEQITEKVAKYSKSKYGIELCFDCQKSQIKEVNV